MFLSSVHQLKWLYFCCFSLRISVYGFSAAAFHTATVTTSVPQLCQRFSERLCAPKFGFAVIAVPPRTFSAPCQRPLSLLWRHVFYPAARPGSRGARRAPTKAVEVPFLRPATAASQTVSAIPPPRPSTAPPLRLPQILKRGQRQQTQAVPPSAPPAHAAQAEAAKMALCLCFPGLTREIARLRPQGAPELRTILMGEARKRGWSAASRPRLGATDVELRAVVVTVTLP